MSPGGSGLPLEGSILVGLLSDPRAPFVPGDALPTRYVEGKCGPLSGASGWGLEEGPWFWRVAGQRAREHVGHSELTSRVSPGSPVWVRRLKGFLPLKFIPGQSNLTSHPNLCRSRIKRALAQPDSEVPSEPLEPVTQRRRWGPWDSDSGRRDAGRPGPPDRPSRRGRFAGAARRPPSVVGPGAASFAGAGSPG